jgi:predicted  nucleic acid-binding Zn-ribbon protein
MATEFKLLKAEIARIERELADAKRKLASLEQSQNGGTDAEVRPFAKLRGHLEGR